MARVRLILCEARPYWDVPLRRQLGAAMELVQAFTWDECRREAEARPGCLIAVELTESNLEEVLRGIAELRETLPSVPVVALSRRGRESWEGIAYEAGAAYFTTSPRQLSPVVELVRRHAAAQAPAEPTLEEEMLSFALEMTSDTTSRTGPP